jgi:hypothetical protein
MSHVRLHLLSAWCLGCCFLGLAPAATAQPEVDGKPDSSAFIRIPKDTDDWTRHFRIGALVGMNISASFKESGAFNLSGNNPAAGVFDDGYVLEDQTGNAGGYTGYWGYNNASQYDAVAQTLQMHSTTSYSTTGSANADGGLFPGFEMAYGDNLWYWKHARVGWELGFGLLPIDISENSSMSATVNQTTYTFDTGGIVMPPAPYPGGFSGQGEPIIATNYTSSASQSSGTVTSTHSLDVMLYTLRLGPSFYWDLTEHVGMSLGAGPAVGIVSGDYKYNETITAGGVSARNTGKIGGTDVTFGGYVNGTLMYHVQSNGNADIFVSAQYMPMGDATISGGGREGRLKLGRQLCFSAGINWPF